MYNTHFISRIQTVSEIHSYEIQVTTGDIVGAGTDATVTFVLFSKSGAEGPFTIDGSGDAFDRNTTRTYFKDSSVFPIEKIRYDVSFIQLS